MERAMKEESANTTESSVMSAMAEASGLLRQIAGPGEPGELKKVAFARALRKLRGASWTYNRVRDLWRQEPRARVSAEELNELRHAAGAREKAERDELAIRVEALEQQLRALASRIPQDADFYGAQADLLRSAVRGMGRADTAET
jgi:hypothetical protein